MVSSLAAGYHPASVADAGAAASARKEIDMRRLALVLSIALVAAVVTGAPTTPRAGAQDSVDDVVAFVRETLDATNAFWTGEFRLLGVPYRAPRVVLARGGNPTPSACDEDEPTIDHSYCESDTTITLDIDSGDEDAFANLADEERFLPIVWIIAHELGHHVQFLLDLQGLADFPANIRYELQADCLSGVFIRSYARAAAWVERGDLDDAVDKVRESADPDDIPEHERDHGTAAQREQAFRRGYDAGTPAGCGVPKP
jgi:predicted metalloprotease